MGKNDSSSSWFGAACRSLSWSATTEVRLNSVDHSQAWEGERVTKKGDVLRMRDQSRKEFVGSDF